MSLGADLRLFALVLCVGGPLSAQLSCTHGPGRGHLVLQGGGRSDPSVDSAFVALAGGANASIVVIPTASAPDTGWAAYEMRIRIRAQQTLGVREVMVLHTRDRTVADSDRFVEPLRHATGVWMLGGGEERLVESYLDTQTEREIRKMLDHGGVVGGISAGAMIQASFLDTTDSHFTARIRGLMRTQGAGGGFGLLTQAFVAPHFTQRGISALRHTGGRGTP